jgi:predicted DsbA family dithiol-disulfide isomerase
MVESSTFQHIAIKHDVSSVPKVIINDKEAFVGAQPIGDFLDHIEKL